LYFQKENSISKNKELLKHGLLEISGNVMGRLKFTSNAVNGKFKGLERHKKYFLGFLEDYIRCNFNKCNFVMNEALNEKLLSDFLNSYDTIVPSVMHPFSRGGVDFRKDALRNVSGKKLV